jgi:hypothetical protein
MSMASREYKVRFEDQDTKKKDRKSLEVPIILNSSLLDKSRKFTKMFSQDNDKSHNCLSSQAISNKSDGVSVDKATDQGAQSVVKLPQIERSERMEIF